MRFVAPTRDELSADVFRREPLACWSDVAHWLQSPHFPAVADLNQGWHSQWRFVQQTPQLLADELHYEMRIAQRGEIATRPDNWHDFFNALIWRRYAPIKAALNARQVAEIARVGPKQRSRAQCALTHFDEGGIIVTMRDRALLPLWDAHDWHGLFWRERTAWLEGRIRADVFGHALLEMALVPDKLITGKALVVIDADAGSDGVAASIEALAGAIAQAHALNDPQQLRPLPLSGIPDWHAGTAQESFYRDAACFQPLRSGRHYPPPLRLAGQGS